MRGALIPDVCPNCKADKWAIAIKTSERHDHSIGGVPLRISTRYREAVCLKCGYTIHAPNMSPLEQEELT